MAGFGRITQHLYLPRRAKARQQAALGHAAAVLDRLQWQLAELRASLERAAVVHAAMARELAMALRSDP